MHIQIGSPNWRNDLINSTTRLGDGFWDHFTPVAENQLNILEKQIGRRLPDEFKEFYRLIGYGNFEPGDGFDSPDDIVACLGAPIYFVRGSLMSGEEWA
ncbi:MAG: SMI1/KNR4 family protein, partial [Thermodesulfovibrionales bacterium]|nr:SMI1/KNR4 family protein [Thermodesulfovibrionales bacterium]